MIDRTLADEALPLVGQDPGNRNLWFGLGIIGVFGLLLFVTLNSSRQANTNVNVPSPRDYATASALRPELIIPDRPTFAGRDQQAALFEPTAAGRDPVIAERPSAQLVRLNRPVEPSSAFAPVDPQFNNIVPVIQPAEPEQGRSAPVIVYDEFQTAIRSGDNAAAVTPTTNQVAKAFAVSGGDRTYLVTQGTLIFAILETAIDSTQSGQVRAIISKDVFNALGNKVLIPKGSRIFGEYRGEINPGQNRASVTWNRLVRPDGATILLDSPAADQLGRAGVKGRVNSHFGQRLLNALLQSTIDFGIAAASRAAVNGSGVVVALPNSVQPAGAQLVQPAPRPTLTVRHGTRISVFVARDLDFAAVN